MIPKFRVWDKQNNCWTNYAISDDLPIFYDKHTGCWHRKNKDRFVLMQSTGERDKNVKEIYIGDIVRGERPSLLNETEKIEIIGIVKESCAEVVIENSKGMYDPLANYFAVIYESGKAEIEVIGNIYETPELRRNLNDSKEM